MTVLAEVIDPDVRRVELTVERWSHIVDERPGHPELVDHQQHVLRAVRAPDVVRPGRAKNERWYFLRGVGPSRWLQVLFSPVPSTPDARIATQSRRPDVPKREAQSRSQQLRDLLLRGCRFVEAGAVDERRRC